MWSHDPMTTWSYDHMLIWWYGHMITWSYDHMIIWSHDYMITWTYDDTIIRKYDHMIAWSYDHMIILWSHDHLITWSYDQMIMSEQLWWYISLVRYQFRNDCTRTTHCWRTSVHNLLAVHYLSDCQAAWHENKDNKDLLGSWTQFCCSLLMSTIRSGDSPHSLVIRSPPKSKNCPSPTTQKWNLSVAHHPKTKLVGRQPPKNENCPSPTTQQKEICPSPTNQTDHMITWSFDHVVVGSCDHMIISLYDHMITLS